MIGLAAIGLSATAQAAVQTSAQQFDFGVGGTAQQPPAGYIAVGPMDTFTSERSFGWLETETLLGRDRQGPAPLKRDLVFGTKKTTFRIAGLTPGRYRLTVIVGDLLYGDHTTRMAIAGIDDAKPLPILHPATATFATLTATLQIPTDANSLDIVFDTPEANWAINALRLEPTAAAEPTRVTMEKAPRPAPKSTWGPVLTWADPTAELLAGHRKRVAANPKIDFKPTGLQRRNYLELITGEIGFWKTQQDKATGAIIDPYRKVEFQYSTPGFAHAASALVVYAGRTDLIEPAAKALDWSARTLSQRKAASAHEDFFAPMIAHAIRLLKPHVTKERSAAWEADIRRFDPFATYRAAVGRGNNWNIVAAVGEAFFQKMGLRDKKNRFVEASFAGQGETFGTPYGLYLEGPMAYDHFPRLWAADLIARGYTGPYYRELSETLRRASITSLFMQSPSGELPAGGRSAQHQWNEAEQCITYEIYAARALRNGDKDLAAYFKRGAHLALGSMRRWVRPSGEMQIIKNWTDPEQAHAFEGYSAHSQYNLLPMSMLATAYEHAETTEKIAEKPAPADVGGYVLPLDALHKVFANAAGTYVEIDTMGDHHYDATGLIRVHFPSVSPQLGTSDSVLAHSSYRVPKDSPKPPTTGIGVAWQGTDGTWHYFGELEKADIKNVAVKTTQATTDRVMFTVRYEGDLHGLSAIEEKYVLTPGRVEVTTVLPGYTGPIRRVVPLLADDGKTKTKFDIAKSSVTVSQPQQRGAGSETFAFTNATSVTLGEELYPNHNGWARIAQGEYPAGAAEQGVTLVISG